MTVLSRARGRGAVLRATNARHCCLAPQFCSWCAWTAPGCATSSRLLGYDGGGSVPGDRSYSQRMEGIEPLPKMVRWRPSAMTHLQPKRASGCMRGAPMPPRQARTRIARSSTGYGTNSGARQLSRHCADWHCTFCSLCRPAQASSHLDRAFASGSAGTWNASPGPHAALSLDGSTSGNSVRSHCYLNFHG